MVQINVKCRLIESAALLTQNLSLEVGDGSPF